MAARSAGSLQPMLAMLLLDLDRPTRRLWDGYKEMG
jgi:hypothetical protein